MDHRSVAGVGGKTEVSVIAYSGTGTVTAASGTLLTLGLQVGSAVSAGVHPTTFAASNANALINSMYAVSNADGTISITGIVTSNGSVTVSGTGVTCSYAITPGTASISSAKYSGSVGVATTAACSWTAKSNNAWLTITKGGSGTGNGNVAFSVATNTTTSPRTGTLTIAGKTFTVTQAAATVSFLKSNPPSLLFGKLTGSRQLSIAAVYANGSIADVTASSTFKSSNAAVAKVSAGGLVNAVADGTAAITATYAGKSVVIPVKVDSQNTVQEFPRAVLSGVPQAKVTSDSYTCSITVGGTGVTAYRYSLDGKAFSSEVSIATLITDVLTPGTHTLAVVGKDATGAWQPMKEATRASWFQEPMTPSGTAVISVSP